MKHNVPDVESPFVFIVGCGRSGTTMLRSMFDSHPEMAIPGESGFLWRHRRRYEKNQGFNVELFIDDLVSHRRFKRWDLGREQLIETLSSPAPKDHTEAIRSLFGLYARARGKRRFGDKTPNHVLQISELAKQFPEARFIHLIRDGRNVALSYLDIKEWGPSSVTEVSLYWMRRVREGRRQGSQLGSERYQEVHYEKLVANPEAELRRLCNFSSLEFDESMLQYFQHATKALTLELHPHRHVGLRKPPTKGLREWRQTMSRDQIACFEAIAGDALTEFGYERWFVKPPLSSFPRLASELGALGLKRTEGFGRGARRRLQRTLRRAAPENRRAPLGN